MDQITPAGSAAIEFTKDSGSPSCAPQKRHPLAGWAGRFQPHATIVKASHRGGSLAAICRTHSTHRRDSPILGVEPFSFEINCLQNLVAHSMIYHHSQVGSN